MDMKTKNNKAKRYIAAYKFSLDLDKSRTLVKLQYKLKNNWAVIAETEQFFNPLMY